MAVREYLPKIAISVIALVVVGSLLFGPFQGALDVVVTDLLRMMGFAQYEASAVNSAKALAYASSCTGIMNLHQGSGTVPQPLQNAWEGPASPDIDRSCSQAGGSSVKFGDVRVECDRLADAGSCRIYNFELPQDPPDLGWGAWISGMGHPKYLLYYEAFPRGPENAWQHHGEQLGAVAVVSGAVLNVAFYGAASRIPISSADDVGSATGRWMSSSDEGAGLIGRTLATAGRLTPWRLMSPSTDDLGRMAIRSNVDDMVRRAGVADDVADSQVDDIADDVYGYFQRQSLADESVDDIHRAVRNRFRRHGVSPDEIEGLSRFGFRRTTRDIARNLDDAGKIARRGSYRGFDDVGEYWKASRTADDISEGLIGSGRTFVREKAENLVQTARRQTDDFESIAASDTYDTVGKKAMLLGCRSRVPRLLAMEGTDAFLADNDNARAVADALFVGSLSAQTVCPGTDLGGARNELSPRSIKALAGLAIAVGYASQRTMSDTDKFTSQGVNAVVLKIPYVSPKVYQINPYANYYYMNLERADAFQSDRKGFYLVSPFTTRDVDTDNPHIEVSHVSLACKKGAGKKTTFRVSAQPTWNDGKPVVDDVKTCRGTVEDNRCDQFNSLSTSARKEVCGAVAGCALREVGAAGAATGTELCFGTIEKESCAGFSERMCGQVGGCSMKTVESQIWPGYTPSDWNNYVHVRDPVDPSQKDEFATTVVSAEAKGIKQCKSPPAVDLTIWDDDSYDVESIQVSAKNMGNWRTSSGEHNYGYNSADFDGLLAKVAVGVAGLTLEVVTPVPTTVLLASTGAAETVLFQHIDQKNAWPEH